MTRFDFRSGRPLALDHLVHGRFWLGLGTLLIALVVLGSLISVPKPVGAAMAHDKLVHLGVYAILMAWFAQLFRHDLTRLLLGLGFVALGVLMECLQGMVPARQFDVIDMIANTSGVLLAWALSYTWMGNLLAAFERRFLRPRSNA